MMQQIEEEKNTKKYINDQIAFNRGKNLFADDEINSLQLIVNESLVESIRNMDRETEELMIDFVTDQALQEFCRVNQYFAFNAAAVNELKAIYILLNNDIRTLDNNASQESLNKLSQWHYERLCNWLVKTNAFAGKMYDRNQKTVEAVACSEYTPDLQLSLLHLDLNTLIQPVLDIGCGREMNLVNFLRDHGIEAYGIDRFENCNPYYIKSDWLEFNYESNSWGTIISNLGFSNHFIHHNLRDDGNYREYAVKYMEILAALEVGGSFCYAPDLSFVEKHLDKQTYITTNHRIEGNIFKCSCINRIK